jgi:mono/diheme cytochrome c family protein
LADDDSREVTALTAPLYKQLARARELLEAQGVKLPEGKAAPTGKGKKDAVSFTKQVAPILVAKCGGCHVQRARGDFSMATYVALSKGSKDGVVIMVGDAKGSRMIELIEAGDMPRGGGKVSAEELALLSSWINAGAKFDGADSAAPLTSFSSAQPAKPAKEDDAAMKIKVVAASGADEVQFARDVGPILLANCFDCHGGTNARNNFSVNTFKRLLKGGDSGEVVTPDKPADSLLMKKLRGTAASGARMPLNRPPLEDVEIAKIEKWIALGAKFDGTDPELGLEETIDLTIAQHATHDELSQRRIELAAKNWRLILPDSKANREETTDVLVYGSASPVLLADVARSANEQAARLHKLFKVPSEQPLIKGRLTLYVFDKRYDYGEVGTMLEHREIPSNWRGHWRYNPVDAYGCVLLTSEGNISPGLVAQQIVGAYLASLGKVPRWFSEGTARAVAAKVEPKDARVKAWDDQIARILQSTDKPENFLTGKLQPEDSDILSYSFVKFLMTHATRHSALVTALQQGNQFDAAFSKVFSGTPSQVVATWAPKAVKRGR